MKARKKDSKNDSQPAFIPLIHAADETGRIAISTSLSSWTVVLIANVRDMTSEEAETTSFIYANTIQAVTTMMRQWINSADPEEFVEAMSRVMGSPPETEESGKGYG